jgi:predicted ATPase/class 3 adenylate cyclase
VPAPAVGRIVPLVLQVPSGTVTFLFTDLEGSTRLWERYRNAMPEALERHDAILREVVAAAGGVVVKSTGDGSLAVFERPAGGIEAAVAIQRAFAAQDWGETGPLLVRIGVHTGVAEERGGDYFGPAVNRAARLMEIGHGGQVLVSSTTAALVEDAPVADVGLREVGEHRLRDLSRPEHVFQVVAPGLREAFPPLRSLDALATNLPVELTSFVGRDAEVKSIVDLLAEHRAVTITGVGGVGKTRLALHVAAELLGDSRDGAWIAELAAVGDGDAMAEVIAAALGVSRRGDASLADGVVESLRSKHLLLVLDNCEHLLGEVADFAEHLVSNCPDVRVLATSREGLGIAGERVWPLRSLSVPASTDGTDSIASSDAAQLLLDRARAVVPNFALDDSNSSAVGEICRRLDGIPLAIELAAARLAAMQPREVAEHLDERFRLLTGGRSRGIERHQTLRATVDWSYSLLDDRDRSVFDRLGVFAGSFDASAAQAVIADDGLDRFDVLDALKELVAKSMIVAEPGPEGGTRYQLLETLRQYALERLDAEVAGDRTRGRHAEYYAHFAETAAPELLGPHELAWRPRVNAEIDDLRAAVIWALDRPEPADAELAMRIVGALAVESVGNRRAGIGSWAERAANCPMTTNSPRRAAVLVAAAFGAFHRLDIAMATEYVERAPDADDPTTYGFTQAMRANLAQSRGDFGEALRINQAALEALGDASKALVGRVLLCTTAIFAITGGHIDLAVELAERTIEDARRLGQPTGLAMALYAKGFVLVYGNRDPDTALRVLAESVALTRAGASDVVFAQALMTLAHQHVAAGRPATAIPALREAVAHSYQAGDQVSVIGATIDSIVAFAALGLDVPVATCTGALVAGAFAPVGYVYDAGGKRDETLAAARENLGDEQFDAAYAHGTVVGYDGIIDFMLATFDAIEAERPAAGGGADG